MGVLCQISLVFHFLMWLDLAYCVGRETYYQGTENLLHIPRNELMLDDRISSGQVKDRTPRNL